MKKIVGFLFALWGVLTLTSCEQEYEKQYNWAYPVAGQWKCNAYVDGELIYGPFEIKTYNTSVGQDSIWIDDYGGNFWEFKIKAAVNMASRTFQTEGSMNTIPDYDDIWIKVTNGAVILKDSIRLDMEFQDDEGTVYTIAGHRSQYYDDYMED